MSKNYEIDGLIPVEEEDTVEAVGSTETSPVAANGKKKKKKWSKKKKTVVGIVSGVIAAILIAVIVVVCVLFLGTSKRVGFDQTNYVIDMGNDYYVGTEGSYDTSLSRNKNVTTIEGAYNVSNYADFVAQLKAGNDVVVHASEFVMTKPKDESGTISVKSSIYGNGVSINAFDVVKGSAKNSGYDAFVVEPGKAVVIRDMKVFGHPMSETDAFEDGLKTFTGYGSLLNIRGDSKNKAIADVYHCIFENSHKVVHIQSAYVMMEGCLVRNAADTAISIGTFKNQASEFISNNNIVADSLTGGILTYCYDGNIDKSSDNKDTWNTIIIEGFLDIYNWKKASELAFIPDTELGGQTGLISSLNSFLSEEIVKPEYQAMRSDVDGDSYVHFGILKIATNGYGVNKAQILYENREIKVGDDKNSNGLGYTMQKFPIPSIGGAFMKELFVTGYFGNNEGSVKVGDIVAAKAAYYKETIGIAKA